MVLNKLANCLRVFAVTELALALLVCSGIVNACDCTLPTLPQSISASAMVFVGTVKTVREDAGYYIAADFDVSAVIKGRAVKQVTVRTTTALAGCTYPFVTGTEYLVFAGNGFPVYELLPGPVDVADYNYQFLKDPDYKGFVTDNSYPANLQTSICTLTGPASMESSLVRRLLSHRD